jgi:hypothetical protein
MKGSQKRYICLDILCFKIGESFPILSPVNTCVRYAAQWHATGFSERDVGFVLKVLVSLCLDFSSRHETGYVQQAKGARP